MYVVSNSRNYLDSYVVLPNSARETDRISVRV